MEIINNPPIIYGSDKGFNEFVKLGVNCFFHEIGGYIKHNNDPEVLGYSNEATLLALFVNGLIRFNGIDYSITSLQEYGTYRKSKDSNGRLDAFIRYNETGIWIEAKYDKGGVIKNRNSHWEIEQWLKWDDFEIMQQLEDYYQAEVSSVNKSYTGHYLMTLAFKKINEEPVSFIKEAENKLEKNLQQIYNRSWYYAVGFLEPDKEKATGLEIYGTFKKYL